MKQIINNFITKLGEKFGFDAHYFTKNTFWLLVGQAMMSISAFFLTVVLANTVSKLTLGDYRLVISLYSILVFFSLQGMGAALMQSVVNGKDGSFLHAVSIKRKYGIAAFLVGTIIALYYGILKENVLFGLSIFISAACIPVIETYSLYIIYLQGKHNFKTSSLNMGLLKVISSFTVIGMAYLYPSAVYLISAFYVTQAIIIYIQYRLFLRKVRLENSAVDEGMLPYAKHSSFAGAVSLVLGQADKFILYHFFGPVALAQYWIASTIPQEVSRVIWTMSQVVYPKFIKGDESQMRRWLPKRIVQITIVLVAISVIYAFMAYPFFSIFFPQYVDQATMSAVLMFAYVVAPYTLIWIFFTSKRNVKVTYISSTVDPVLQILFYILFIPLYGVWGVVYALVSKTILMNLISWFILKRY